MEKSHALTNRLDNASQNIDGDGNNHHMMDILDALHQATLNRDDKAVAQVVQAYAQTPAAQAFMQEGKAQNEQAKAQEQQAATMVQVEPESQQRSAPSMRR